MTEFRNISGVPQDLEGGRVVGVLEIFELSEDDLNSDHNKEIIAAGGFIEIPQADPDAPQPPTRAELLERAGELDISGRHSMNVNELQQAIIDADAENGEDS